MKNHNYHAHHLPIGAFAAFTLDFCDATGRPGLERGGPANHNVYIGVEDEDRAFRLLPFFKAVGSKYDPRGVTSALWLREG